MKAEGPARSPAGPRKSRHSKMGEGRRAGRRGAPPGAGGTRRAQGHPPHSPPGLPAEPPWGPSARAGAEAGPGAQPSRPSGPGLGAVPAQIRRPGSHLVPKEGSPVSQPPRPCPGGRASASRWPWARPQVSCWPVPMPDSTRELGRVWGSGEGQEAPSCICSLAKTRGASVSRRPEGLGPDRATGRGS